MGSSLCQSVNQSSPEQRMRSSIRRYSILLVVLLAMLDQVRCFSYTSDGAWEKVDSENDPICKQYLCTPGKFAWKQKAPSVLYNNITACDALVKKGIKKIVYYGDSYMRQIYAAMLITLNGNYASGSMVNPAKDPQCRYHTLFQEKRCNYWNLNHYGVVCDGRVILDPLLHNIRESAFWLPNGTVALWSLGNHQLGAQRYGVNDAVAHQHHFEREGTCAHFRDNAHLTGQINPDGPYTVWWVSTHARVVGHFGDETPEKVKTYNEEMRQWIDSGACGRTNYIDVYNMTESIVQKDLEEANKLTWDQVHWGFEINLNKAQIILNALLSQ